MAEVVNAMASTPPTITNPDDDLPTASRTMPSAVSSTVGTSVASMRMSCARRRKTLAGGRNRIGSVSVTRLAGDLHLITRLRLDGGGDGAAPFVEDLLRRRAHVGHQPQHLHPAQDPVGHVEFPPVEALVAGRLVAVVVVVPPLAQRDQREEPVVLGVVVRRVP